MEFKRIEEKMEKYDAYVKALSWDNKNTYSQDKDVGLDWMFDKMVGVYEEDELIALGCITRYFDNECKRSYANISSIVRKDYRNKGISKILLNHLVAYCKDLEVKTITIEILKTNKISIKSIQNSDFEYKEETDKVLVYQKKLINK